MLKGLKIAFNQFALLLYMLLYSLKLIVNWREHPNPRIHSTESRSLTVIIIKALLKLISSSALDLTEGPLRHMKSIFENKYRPMLTICYLTLPKFQYRTEVLIDDIIANHINLF